MKRSYLGIYSLIVFALVYAANSFFILIKDHFILERYALTFHNPSIQALGIKLSYILHANSLSTIFLTTAIIGMASSYYLIIKQKPKLSNNTYIKLFALLGLIFFISYPSLSSDVFDYNNYNRVQFLHQANPWIYPANTFPNDQVIYFGNWIDRTSSYPTVSHKFFQLIFIVFGANIPMAMLGFKLTNIAIIGLIFILLAKYSKASPQAFNLIFFNPLLWIEFAGNAHNDLLLGLFILLTIIGLKRKNILLASITFTLSVFTKITSVILLPLLIIKIFLLTALAPTVTFIALTIVFSFICLFPMLPVLPEYQANLLLQTNLQLRSAPFIIRQFFIFLLGGDKYIDTAQNYQKLITTPTLVAAFLFITTKLKKLNYADISIVAFLAYLLISSPMLSPWYLGWFLPLLALAKNSRIKFVAVTFTLTSLLSYPMYFLSLYLKPFIGLWQLAMYLVMALPPILILFIPRSWYDHLTQKLHLSFSK